MGFSDEARRAGTKLADSVTSVIPASAAIRVRESPGCRGARDHLAFPSGKWGFEGLTALDGGPSGEPIRIRELPWGES